MPVSHGFSACRLPSVGIVDVGVKHVHTPLSSGTGSVPRLSPLVHTLLVQHSRGWKEEFVFVVLVSNSSLRRTVAVTVTMKVLNSYGGAGCEGFLPRRR